MSWASSLADAYSQSGNNGSTTGAGSSGGMMATAAPNTYQAMQSNDSDLSRFAKAIKADTDHNQPPPLQLSQFQASAPQAGYTAPQGGTATMQRRQMPVITGYNL